VDILENFINWLNHNSWLNLLFLILAVLSIITSLVLYIRSKKEKSPYLNLRTFQLVEDRLNKIDAVEILYKSQKINNLALTKFALWNKGRDTINIDDVAPKDPLRLVVSTEYQLLGAEIIYIKTQANNFSITPDLEKGEIQINFDYFHMNEGIVIQIYHTGKSNDDIALHGTIKGVARIEHFKPGEDYLTDSFLDRLFSFLPTIKVKSMVTRIVVFILMFILLLPIILPIGFPLFIIDMIMKPLRRAPREYGLE
jgi:hypothetical protein